MNCEQIGEKFSTYIDRELSPHEQIEVQRHITGCDMCRAQMEQFVAMGELIRRSEATEYIPPPWEAIEKRLDQGVVTPIHSQDNRSKWIYIAFATAASLGVLWFALFDRLNDAHSEHNLAEKDHVHASMVVDFQHILEFAQTDPKAAIEKLVAKYQGQELDQKAATNYLGYEPALYKPLPPNLTRVSTHVLNMPCCKCSASICQRKDGTSFLVFEHKEEQPVWFGEASSIETQCAGHACRIIESAGNLAVTWKNKERQLTMIGAKDITEIDELIASLSL